MREILFRAKDESTKEWVYGFYVHLPSAAGSVHIMHVPDENNDARYIDPETLGQYTGVDDMNGVKIFEGDIIKNTFDGEIFEVSWDSLYSAFVKTGKRLIAYGMPRLGGKFTEIVGNIHDNPEMLVASKRGDNRHENTS